MCDCTDVQVRIVSLGYPGPPDSQEVSSGWVSKTLLYCKCGGCIGQALDLLWVFGAPGCLRTVQALWVLGW